MALKELPAELVVTGEGILGRPTEGGRPSSGGSPHGSVLAALATTSPVANPEEEMAEL